jgi:hypothetical protein
MSWEEIRRDTRPCRCGKGLIDYVVEMDDWNRCESWEEVRCLACRRENEAAAREDERRAKLREAAAKKAVALAKERYLAKWLERFGGKSKKAVWLALTNQGEDYPSLGTFYTHLKHHDSTAEYLTWRFEQDVGGVLKAAGVRDREIEGLLQEARSP